MHPALQPHHTPHLGPRPCTLNTAPLPCDPFLAPPPSSCASCAPCARSWHPTHTQPCIRPCALLLPLHAPLNPTLCPTPPSHHTLPPYLKPPLTQLLHPTLHPFQCFSKKKGKTLWPIASVKHKDKLLNKGQQTGQNVCVTLGCLE